MLSTSSSSSATSSAAHFFTLPFRRKKQRYCVNPPDDSYSVIYLGNVLTALARGDGCVEKPLALIWKAYCARTRPDLNMQLQVTRSGLKAETKQQGLTEYWAHRITYSAAPSEYPRIFCWVYKHDGKRMKPELRCHAVLCKKSSEPALITARLHEFLHAALQEYRREKVCLQNSRIASTATGGAVSLPRRKMLLHTGSLNFRPPVSRSKSAPRLGSIDEEEEDDEEMCGSDVDSVCYREQPIGDAASSSSSRTSSLNGGSLRGAEKEDEKETRREEGAATRLELDAVSDESGFHEHAGNLDDLFYSDEELIILEEELEHEELQITSL